MYIMRMLTIFVFALIFAASAAQLRSWVQVQARIAMNKAHYESSLTLQRENRNAPDLAMGFPAKSRIDLTHIRVDTHPPDFPIVVRGLRIDNESATALRLPFTDQTIELRGRYPAIKDWLNQQLADHPGVVLLTLDLRRDTASPAGGAPNSSVNATARLRQYVRPRLTGTLGQPPQAPGTTAFP